MVGQVSRILGGENIRLSHTIEKHFILRLESGYQASLKNVLLPRQVFGGVGNDPKYIVEFVCLDLKDLRNAASQHFNMEQVRQEEIKPKIAESKWEKHSLHT